jgi:LmbE family N-acetylglucosaminyl deacetylase
VTVFVASPYLDGPGPCLVLAPHADDESLGCGGTIAAKRGKGVRVVVAVATDGALSDSLGRPPDEVVAVREREALAACAELGVPSADVRFLRLPDGSLADHIEELVARLDRIVAEIAPDEILVATGFDPHPDHRALRHGVDVADLQGARLREYLVWAWPAWPLSARPLLDVHPMAQMAAMAGLARRGRVSKVGPFRDRKAAAISRYSSQHGDGGAGRGLPPRMLSEFGGAVELLLAGKGERRARPARVRSWLAPGSRPRTWVRERAPWLRDVVLAPRRALTRHQWARRHVLLSEADRAVLTEEILPALRDEAAGADVLFVGVEWYTAGYPAVFPQGNLLTMDIDGAVARYGSPRHLTADVRELDQHVEAGSLAAIVCNGVFGYGVDSPDDVRSALGAMQRTLRPGGVVVIGWNDTEDRRVAELDALARSLGLQPAAGAGLATSRTGPIGPLRHVYDVYRKDSSAGGGPTA